MPKAPNEGDRINAPIILQIAITTKTMANCLTLF